MWLARQAHSVNRVVNLQDMQEEPRAWNEDQTTNDSS